MDDATVERAWRRGWLLAILGALWLLGLFLLAFHTNRPAPPARWDMGGTAFVPASSIQADGWPVTPQPVWPEPPAEAGE